MSCNKTLALLILLALVCLSCSRGAPQGTPRLAIIAFEDLSASPELNWAGRAMAGALAYNLAPSPEIQTVMVNSLSEALTSPASEILQGYYSVRQGRIRIVATLENLISAKTKSIFTVEGSESDGLLPLLNQLAKQISPAAQTFGTAKPDAFRAYAEALNARDAQAILSALQTAETSDPHFAAAFLFRAKVLLAEGQRDGALKELAAGRAANPNAIDSAEIDYLVSGLRGDRDGRMKAVEALAGLTPADTHWTRELAELRLAARQFRGAAQAYERLTQIAPDEPDTWNQLGYAYAYALDLANARRALEHYSGMLGTANWNALDSLGEVSFYLGDFGAAEKYFLQARQNNAGRAGDEMLKAAQARLMTGDLPGADQILDGYLRLARPAQRGLAEFEKVQWQFLTGRRKAGMAELARVIPSLDPEQQSLALSQLAVWKLETGSTDQLDQIIAKSEALAHSSRARSLSELCRYIVTGPAASSGSRVADAYAFLFARKFEQALPLLVEMYRQTNPAQDGQIRSLAAWAYVETHHVDAARELVATYPIPLASGDRIFASLAFPRFLQVRAVVLEKEGKSADARQSQDLFVKYSGDLPDVFERKPGNS